MKVLENKRLTLRDENGAEISYAVLGKMVMRQSEMKGVLLDEMQIRLNIRAEFDKNAEEFRFEDEWARVLQRLVKGHRFPGDQEQFLEFGKDVAAMPEADKAEAT